MSERESGRRDLIVAVRERYDELAAADRAGERGVAGRPVDVALEHLRRFERAATDEGLDVRTAVAARLDEAIWQELAADHGLSRKAALLARDGAIQMTALGRGARAARPKPTPGRATPTRPTPGVEPEPERDPGPFDVPGPDATWADIENFALTYDAYKRHGGNQGAGELANHWERLWHESSQLPDELPIVRAALFFEQRRWRHFGEVPEGRDMEYMRALVTRIRDLSGGQVPGPSDWPPWATGP